MEKNNIYVVANRVLGVLMAFSFETEGLVWLPLDGSLIGSEVEDPRSRFNQQELHCGVLGLLAAIVATGALSAISSIAGGLRVDPGDLALVARGNTGWRLVESERARLKVEGGDDGKFRILNFPIVYSEVDVDLGIGYLNVHSGKVVPYRSVGLAYVAALNLLQRRHGAGSEATAPHEVLRHEILENEDFERLVGDWEVIDDLPVFWEEGGEEED